MELIMEIQRQESGEIMPKTDTIKEFDNIADTITTQRAF